MRALLFVNKYVGHFVLLYVSHLIKVVEVLSSQILISNFTHWSWRLIDITVSTSVLFRLFKFITHL